WHPEVERIADERAVEFFRRDADDGVLDAVHKLRFSNDVGIAFVTIFPRHVTDDCDRVRVASGAFFRSESAAEDWSYAERVEIIRGARSAGRTLRAVALTQCCPGDVICYERF